MSSSHAITLIYLVQRTRDPLFYIEVTGFTIADRILGIRGGGEDFLTRSFFEGSTESICDAYHASDNSDVPHTMVPSGTW